LDARPIPGKKQDQHYRHRQRAHGQGRTIEQDARQNDSDHDERALRRNLIAGKHEIEGRYHQCGEGGPFFDGCAIGETRDQSEKSPDNKKISPATTAM
jgi:hypothetical protein